MEFLKEVGFNSEEIENIKNNFESNLKEKCENFPVLIVENIKYLQNLKIPNYKELFIDYPHIFLKDNSVFEDMFSKYDTEDLIDKIEKNPGIIEYL